MIDDTIELIRVLGSDQPILQDVLARPGTKVTLLAGSRDPNAKMTFVLLDQYGPSFVIKVPTTREAERVVRNEGYALDALAVRPLGSLSATLPRPVGFMSFDGRSALVSTALIGAPMSVAYHGWHHTARRRAVRRDFAAAGNWLADLQTRTAGTRQRTTLISSSAEKIARRFAGSPKLPTVNRVLNASAGRLNAHTTPRTVVHGDFWFGNLLMKDNKVNGVVDWESCVMSGEPLQDVARFAVSYALYLDRHTKVHHRVRGHAGLRAGVWGSGISHMLSGRGWFPAIVQNYLTLSLGRLGVPTYLWRDVLIGGIADVAATADHPDFAEEHFRLLARIIPAVPTVVAVPVPRPTVEPEVSEAEDAIDEPTATLPDELAFDELSDDSMDTETITTSLTAEAMPTIVNVEAKA